MNDLFSIAVQNVAVALLLALLVWGLTRILKNPPVAHLLWLLVLVKLVTPPVVHLDLWKSAWAPVQGGNEQASDASSAVQPPIGESGQSSLPIASQRARGDAELNRAADGGPKAAAEGGVQRAMHVPVGITMATAWSTIRPSVIWIWVGGACLVALLVGIRIVRFQRVLAGTLPASQRLQSVASELADRMGLPRAVPNVRVVDSAVAPLLWCMGRRATVVLPRRLLDALDEHQTAMVLAHELAHLRRRDHWVRLVELVASVLYWWNPLVWWVRRELHAVEEQCCDAWVAWVYPNRGHDYAESLLKAAELSPDQSSRLIVASPFLRSDRLKERIEMVLQNRWRRKASRKAAICLVLLAAVVIPAGLQFKQAESKDAGPAVSKQITVAKVQSQAVSLTQRYVAKIHAHHYIQVRAPAVGYLEAIAIKAGQTVKAGDVMFQINPILFQKKADAENAEAQHARLAYHYTKDLFEKKVVSEQEVLLVEAELKKAQANADLASAQLSLATVRAPFSGMVGRLAGQQGSLVEQGETLTTLSDNSLMWVYFNVPEGRYLEYQSAKLEHEDDLTIELVLASGNKFDQPGKLGSIGADFDNTTGNLVFRADFPNPQGLLRNGQSGAVLISRVQKDALVIPQRATLEILGKRYAYVVDKDGVAHQREIDVQDETAEVLFVVKNGLGADDKIVIEGIRRVHDGDKVQ